jgi:hypothetical protein
MRAHPPTRACTHLLTRCLLVKKSLKKNQLPPANEYGVVVCELSIFGFINGPFSRLEVDKVDPGLSIVYGEAHFRTRMYRTWH